MTDTTLPTRIEEDMRGQVCPSTLIIALDRANTNKAALRTGKVVLVIKTDNRDATATIPGAMHNMGYETMVTKKMGYYEILIGVDLARDDGA